jgi:hypothetical protein
MLLLRGLLLLELLVDLDLHLVLQHLENLGHLENP